MTLKRLWNRESLTDPWLAEVNEWLLSAGWTLLHAGSTFGVVRTSVVENWPRIASKRIQEVLDQVARGNFDFSKIEHLLEPVSLDDSASSASSQKRSPRTRRST
jgi:hypothetical protein